MSTLLLPSSGITPSYSAGYARSPAESANPGLWNGLVGAWVPMLGVTGKRLHDVSGHHNDGILVDMDGDPWVMSEEGIVLNFTGGGAGSDDIIELIRAVGPFANCTVMARVNRTLGDYINLFSGGGVSGERLYCYDTGDNVNWYVDDDSNVSWATTDISSGVWQQLGVTFQSGVNANLWIDGKDQGLRTTGGGDTVSLANLGANNAAQYSWSGQIASWYFWDRVLSKSEIHHLHLDHLALFRASPLYVSGSGEAGATIDCNLGTLSIAGLQASIDAQTTIACSLGTVSVAGLAAGIDAQTTIACSLGTVTVAGLAASVEAQTTLACSLGTVAIDGLQASILTGTTIACNLGTVSIAGLQASIDAQTTIACSLGTVSIAGLQATIETGTYINCSLGTVSVSGLQATITAATLIECSLGTVEISGLQAAVTLGVTLECSLGELVAAGLQAAIDAQTTMACTLGTVTIAGLKSNIVSGQPTGNALGMTVMGVFSAGMKAVEVYEPGLSRSQVRP